MAKQLPKILIKLVALFVLLLIGGMMLAMLYEDKVGKKVADVINENIESKFEFESFDLSFIRHFPSVSISFNDITFTDLRDQVFIRSKHFDTNINLFKMLQSQIAINAVEIEDGEVLLHRDKKGINNYKIFKIAESQEKSNVSVQIDKISFSDIHLRYKDLMYDNSFSFIIDDVISDISLVDDQINSNSVGKALCEEIISGKQRFLAKQKIGLDLNFSYHIADDRLSFHKSEMAVNKDLFELRGDIAMSTNTYDLTFNNNNGDIQTIISFLPSEDQKKYSDITSSGNFKLSAFYKGRSTKKNNPNLQVDIRFDKGTIHVPKLGVPVKNVSFSGKFVDGKYRGLKDAIVQINDFSGKLSGEDVRGNLVFKNFTNPDLKLDIKGKLPIKTILTTLGTDAKNIEGVVDINQLHLDGLLKHISSPLQQRLTNSKVDIVVDHAQFEIDDHPVVIESGRIQGEADFYELEDLKVKLEDSDFNFSGQLKRLIPYLFAQYQKPELEFDLDISSEYCDAKLLHDLYNSVVSNQAQAVATSASGKREEPDTHLDGDIVIQVGSFDYDQIAGEQFNGRLSVDKGKMLLEGTAIAMNGKIDVDGMVNLEGNRFSESKIICEGIDVKEFFRQSKNFDQETITDKHLKGKLDATIAIDAFWDAEGRFLSDELVALAAIQITDGELKNFDMLRRFSDYIKIEDLRNIKFANMENFLKIENKVIEIPSMFIQSNAVNLTVSGSHTFDNEIDYNIKLNAGQVVMTKIKKHDRNLNPIKARKKGFFNMYYQVDGFLSNPKYRTNKRHVKADLTKSKLLKTQLKNEIERRFNIRLDESFDKKMFQYDSEAEFRDRELTMKEEYLFEIEGAEGKNN